MTVEGTRYSVCTRYLARVVAEPPRDARDVELRREVLRELAASASARGQLERIYVTIVRLRALLCAPRQPSPRGRRIEILRTARELFDLLAGSFEGATSALGRLRAFGGAVVAGDGYRRLVALLEHEENQSALDLHVRIGADGEVRSMKIVGIRESRDNPFYLSVLRRFIVRVIFFFRGYRTTSGEVAERVLSDVLTAVEDEVGICFPAPRRPRGAPRSALGFRDRAAAASLGDDSARDGAPGRAARDRGPVQHPLLLASGVTPKPCGSAGGSRRDRHRDGAQLGGQDPPASGDRDRVQLLAEGGFFGPGPRPVALPRASGLPRFALRGSTGGQVPKVISGWSSCASARCFDELSTPAPSSSLDELCSGTNPSEGEEIAALVLSLLPELGVRAFVTTHLLKFADRLEHGPGASLEFLQVELDAQERPTYRFMPGVARTSLAHKTAERLGVTREELLQRIKAKSKTPT